jgi:hypothetical protein
VKIGLIQTQGIGDIIIGLPIAKWFTDRGHQVFWPVSEHFVDFLALTVPYVTFLGIVNDDRLSFTQYCYDKPLESLEKYGCDRILVLNMNLPAEHTLDRRLASSLKFDEYKYALAGVPFSEKWTLSLTRDPGREQALHKSLELGDTPYICIHGSGSDFKGELKLPPGWRETYKIVEIAPITDSPFDWLYTIEHAAKLVLIDSMFANLVEQLNIGVDKYLIQRSVTALTPVYKNGWRFCWPGDTIEES